MFSRDELIEIDSHVCMCLAYHKACIETVLESLSSPSSSGVREQLVAQYQSDIQNAQCLRSRIKEELDKTFGA